MEEVRHWGRALRLPTPAQCSTVGCELTASCSDHHACRLEWTVTRGHREPSKPLVAAAVLVFSQQQKVAKTLSPFKVA